MKTHRYCHNIVMVWPQYDHGTCMVMVVSWYCNGKVMLIDCNELLYYFSYFLCSNNTLDLMSAYGYDHSKDQKRH